MVLRDCTGLNQRGIRPRLQYGDAPHRRKVVSVVGKAAVGSSASNSSAVKNTDNARLNLPLFNVLSPFSSGTFCACHMFGCSLRHPDFPARAETALFAPFCVIKQT
jgi:hypothetical protein